MVVATKSFANKNVEANDKEGLQYYSINSKFFLKQYYQHDIEERSEYKRC